VAFFEGVHIKIKILVRISDFFLEKGEGGTEGG
jgi:hypothetical protein